MKLRTALSFLATLGAATVLDLVWLSTVANSFYGKALGPLKRPEPYWPAAALFYGMYVLVTFLFAVRGARSMRDAALRGLGLGFVSYATYELTNWAVIAGWPVVLVPVDIVWGCVLTTVAAVCGRRVLAPAAPNE
jgi:uncharacterized membrane protein